MNKPGKPHPKFQEKLEKERFEILAQIEDWLEKPMIVLGFIWLILLIVEMTRGLSPVLENLGMVIWALFVVDFLLKFLLAPKKLIFLRGNILTMLSLMLPALRVLRVIRLVRIAQLARAGRTLRALRLLRVVTSVNRGMRALGGIMGRRGFGYVMLTTLIVTFAGAAGMYAFENDNPDGRGLNDYGSAFWWTAMIITTLGSEYWPQTAAGRVLCLLISIYALSVLGYITAFLASFFIDRESEKKSSEQQDLAKAIEGLRREVVELKKDRKSNQGRLR